MAETLQLDLWLELNSIRNRVKDGLEPEWDRDWGWNKRTWLELRWGQGQGHKQVGRPRGSSCFQ